MFSSFHKPLLFARFGQRWLSSRSISRNLTFLHILAVFISFSCASLFLYHSLVDDLNEFSHKRINEEMASVKAMLRARNNWELLDTELKSQLYESESHKVYIRIIDRHGSVIKESTGMAELLPVSLFPAANKETKNHELRLPGGKPYLLKNETISDINFIADGGEIQIGKDISRNVWVSKEFLTSLGILFLVLLIFAIASAYYIVRKGLKPISEISWQIEQITEFDKCIPLDSANLPMELRSLGHSFNTMLNRMENSFNKLSQYSENLAHELRTPLNNLMLEAEVALSHQRTAGEYRQVIKSSVEEYGRLSLLIERLLFLVRADNNNLNLDLTEIDVQQELESIADFFSETVLEKDIAVTIDGTASLMVDMVLFNRAISNLFSNAIKYTERGGSITLGVKYQENDTIEISVRDTGSGISPELLPKIFDRYFWVESTRDKDVKGTGLGLDIIKAIMKLHGGNVSIKSELGKGTTVSLLFPMTTCS